MSIEEKDAKDDGAHESSTEEAIVISNGHTHVYRVSGKTRDEAAKQLAHEVLANIFGATPDELEELEDPVMEPMTIAQVEAHWRKFGAEIATPLSESTLRRMIDRDIEERRRKGLLLEG